MRKDIEIVRTFVKILRHEAKLGFVDRAVVGGMDSFVENHRLEISESLDIGDQSYSSLNLLDRKVWVSNLLDVSGDLVPNELVYNSYSPNKNLIEHNKLRLDDPVIRLRTVTGRAATILEDAFSIKTVEDLIYHLPHRHNDYSAIRKVNELKADEDQTTIVQVRATKKIGTRGKTNRVIVDLYDETGSISVTFFNQPWILRDFRRGTRLTVSGLVKRFKGRLTFGNPSYEVVDSTMRSIHSGRIVPVYDLTNGVKQRSMRRMVNSAIRVGISDVQDHIPDVLLDKIGLLGLSDALKAFHYPRDLKEKSNAKRRLVFDEFFLIQLIALKSREEWKTETSAIPLNDMGLVAKKFVASLPFELTTAQRMVVNELYEDMSANRAMQRLLQGDVGSGKTVVAISAMLLAAENGYQSVLMAPTEILAEQHFITLKRLLNLGGMLIREGSVENIFYVSVDGLDKELVIALLTGSMTPRSKEDVQELIRDGSVDIVLGTHTLIQDSVEFPRLALAVVDEQHRFGVIQRSILRQQSKRPHLLVMSATPIPRSLTLTVYGDLDISVLDELPQGRKVVKTFDEKPTRRDSVYDFIGDKVSEGRQGFVVCPLIEQSESIDAPSAIEEHLNLSSNVFPHYRVGLLHGRMSLNEKEAVMARFRDGEIDILVTTPVVEVGVDVPNATVMFIDGADRFGLSQMHQFRGRVGRGKHQSYCVLMAHENAGPEAKDRIDILRRTNDGFKLAEEDLRLRGPGDLMGTRQSGQPVFKVATWPLSVSDHDLMTLAFREARSIIAEDPELTMAQNLYLKLKVEKDSLQFGENVN